MNPYHYAGLPTSTQYSYRLLRSRQFTEYIPFVFGIVCSYFSVDPDLAKGSSRKGEYVKVRQITIYLCRKQYHLPWSELSGFFSGRDHSTGIYSYQTCQDLIDTNKHYRKQVLEIQKLI